MTYSRIAVVLFNLGGPDSPEAVKPFLLNLFNDPAIIGAPWPIRTLIARLISSRRAPTAREIYAHMGGKSPLLEQTQAQADALDAQLNQLGDAEWKSFIAMRYWHPFADETARAVTAWKPDAVLLVPLYPQFSTTTTGSSLTDWGRAATKAGLAVPHHTVCCYPTQTDFVQAHVDNIRTRLAGISEPYRILFSAHGLPEKIVAKGDPYQWQVEQTVQGIVQALAVPGLDHVVCYQSRVGPLKWIGPSTDNEIRRAGADGKAIIMVPVAFVSEHSETLVELDIEYRHLAESAGVPAYVRVPALSNAPGYIAALANVCRSAASRKDLLAPDTGVRLCPADRTSCLCSAA